MRDNHTQNIDMKMKEGNTKGDATWDFNSRPQHGPADGGEETDQTRAAVGGTAGNPRSTRGVIQRPARHHGSLAHLRALSSHVNIMTKSVT